MAFSLTSIPVLVNKHKGFWVLGSFYMWMNLLFLACYVNFGGTWFGITLISVLFGFTLVFLPYILRQVPLGKFFAKQKTLIYFIVNTILLFLVELVVLSTGNASAYVYKSTFLSTLYSVTLPWIFMVIIRYVKTNGFIKTAICSFVVGIYILFSNSILNTMIDGKPFRLLPINLAKWHMDSYYNSYLNGNITFIIFLSCVIISIIFAIAGVMREMHKEKRAALRS